MIRTACSDAGRWPLYLWSKATGTGKTTLAILLLDRAFGPCRFDYYPQQATDVMFGLIDYRNFPNHLEAVRRREWIQGSYEHREALTESKVWNFIGYSPLIVVDDVCDVPREAVKFGHDHRGLLKQILDIRAGKPTILTGNLTPRSVDGKPSEFLRVMDLATADPITDRVLSGTVHEMTGVSLRWN